MRKHCAPTYGSFPVIESMNDSACENPSRDRHNKNMMGLNLIRIHHLRLVYVRYSDFEPDFSVSFLDFFIFLAVELHFSINSCNLQPSIFFLFCSYLFSFFWFFAAFKWFPSSLLEWARRYDCRMSVNWRDTVQISFTQQCPNYMQQRGY